MKYTVIKLKTRLLSLGGGENKIFRFMNGASKNISLLVKDVFF